MTMINNSFLVTLLVIAVLTANVCYRSNNVNIPTVIFQDPTNNNTNKRSTTSSSSSFIRRRIRKLQSENEEEKEEEAPVESSEQTQNESNDAQEADIESTPELNENQDEPIVEEEPVSETHDENTVIDGVDVDSAAEEYSEEIESEEESQEKEEEEVVDEPAEEAVVETNEEINEEPNTESVEGEVNEETQQLDEESQPQEETIDEANTESATPEVNEETQQLDEEVQPQEGTIDEANTESATPEVNEETQQLDEEFQSQEETIDEANTESATPEVNKETQQVDEESQPQEGTIDDANTESATPEVNEETQQLDEEVQPQDESTEEFQPQEGTIDEANTESVEEEEVNEETQQLDEEFQPQDESTEETANEMNDEIDETNENVDEESDANSVEPSESMEDFQADEPKEEIVEVGIDIEENDEIKTEWQDTDSVEPESNEESQSEEDEEEATEEAITETHDEGDNEANDETDEEESNTDSSIPESTEDVQPIETQEETQEVEEITESYDETNAEESNTESTVEEFNEEFQSEENSGETADFVDQSPSDELQYDQIQEEPAEEPLIDFVIAGFPKSGTTYLNQAVLNVSQVYMGWPTDQTPKEVHDLEKRQKFVQKFINRYDLSKHPNYFNDKYKYHRIYNEEKVINGFKAPMLVEHADGLQNLFNLAPDVDFVMTTRHPVLWFQSFWNFRARDGRNMPSPLDLIGNCDTGCDSDDSKCQVGASSNADSVCTGAAKFHHYLARLQFTPMNTPEELDLLSLRHSTFDFTGRMFIMEVSQMSDENLDRLDSFKSALTMFLKLKPDTLPSLTTAKDEYDVSKRSPEYLLQKYKNIKHNLSQSQKERFVDVDMTENMDTELMESMLNEAVEKIDICEEKYAPLRQKLVDIGSNAATWIEDYLLESPRVVVANKDNFIGLINLWKLDPCDKENESVSRARERGLLEWDHVIHEGY